MLSHDISYFFWDFLFLLNFRHLNSWWMSLFKVTLKSLPKVTLYTHSSVTPTSHSQKSLSEVTLKSHSQKSLSKFTPKSFSKVTLRSHSQKSLSKVTLRSHSQKPLPSHSQKSLQRSLQRSLPPTHTQPYLLPYAADRLQHLLGGHPGLPIHQDTLVTSALR